MTRIVVRISSGPQFQGWLVHTPDGALVGMIRMDTGTPDLGRMVGPHVLLSQVVEITRFQWHRMILHVPTWVEVPRADA